MTVAAAARAPERLWVAAMLGAFVAAVALAPAAAALLLIPVCGWTLATPDRWLATFFFAALLLPPLPIPLGDSGPHPSLLFAGLGVLAGLAQLGVWRWRWDAVGAALAALAAALVASVGMAALYSGPALAAQSLARVALFGISVYVFFFETRGAAAREDPWKMARRLYWWAAGAALFACFDFYFQWPPPAGFGPQFVWTETGVYRRAQGLFYEASTLGNLCAFFLVMIAVALARPGGQSPVSRRGLAAGAAVFLPALLLSFSRASLVNVGVAVTVLLYLHRGRISWRRVIAFGLPAAAAGMWLAGVFFRDVLQHYFLRLWASAAYLLSATEGVLSGRLESWRTLGAFAAEHPWRMLLGVGYKTLPYSRVAGGPVVADNMYLSLLVETGVAGLAAMGALSAAILRAGYRAARSEDARASFFGTWILCFWAGQMMQMLSGDLLTYWRVMPVYFWVLAAAVRR